MRDPVAKQEMVCRTPWWREGELLCVLILLFVAYFVRLGDLPLRGEEPTRVQSALEMVARHDFIVPREQGEPFLVRPPLQFWVIAAACRALGSWDAWAVRFPSLLATLLTTLLIYGYSRSFLSRLGAFAAAAAFATLADMFQMGRQAETEAVFILFVSASLLTWHWGIMRHWPEAVTYSLGYGFMALGMLTKGLQAPTYFMASQALYLLVTGQGRRLWSRAHGLGVLVCLALLLCWVIPYAHAVGWPAVPLIWGGDPAINVNGRILDWNLNEMASHLLRYPFEIAAGTLPWSVLLLLYLRRDFRRALAAARPPVLFLSICLTVAFPTCWLPPGGQPRYFAPLFPCLAVLVGVGIQRCAEADARSALRAAWRLYLGAAACVMLLAAVAVLVATLCWARHPVLSPWAEPPLVALTYALVAVALAILVLRARNGGPSQAPLPVLALACFMAMTFSGVVSDIRLRRSEQVADAVRQLKETLPPGQPLVSLGGHIHSLFAYHYGLPFIASRPWPTSDDQVADLAYFCFAATGESRPQLPFAWEEVGAISVDRNHHPVPQRVTVVGRRLPPVVAATKTILVCP
jgi:4-amino-4-deoxy-L-arabinose transferase-like glycosyltransferase